MNLRSFGEQMNLSQKGLLLVAIPLVSQLVFALAIFVTLQQHDQELQAGAYAKASMDELAKFDSAALRVLLSNSIAMVSGSYSWRKHAEEARTDANKRLGNLRKIAKADPQALNSILAFEQILARAKETIAEARELHEMGCASEGIRKGWEVRQLMDDMQRVKYSLMKHYRELGVRTPKMIRQAQEQLQIYLELAFALNVVVAIFMALFFGKTISQRLLVLSDNARRFAADEPLLPPLQGHDEIASVDKIFRSMSNEISEERRQDRAIADNAVELICSLDTQFRFNVVSKSAKKILGLSQEQLKNKPMTELVLPQDQDRTLKLLSESIRTGKASEFEITIVKADGASADFHWSVLWSPAEASIFCVAHDISEQKQQEKLRREFVAMVSHDLRSPLTTITLSLQVLLTGTACKLSQRTEHVLSQSEQSAGKLLTLIDDLLNLEKIDSGKLDVFARDLAVDTLLQSAVASVAELAKKAGVDIKIESNDGLVQADADRIVQVLINLLRNAINSSPAGSEINLSVQASGDWQEFRVVDRSTGIPPELQEKVFERFQQVSLHPAHNQSGFALGLPISKAIVEEHGGSIGLESEVGKGSTFWFRLHKSV